jgi:hypothetical protein
MAFRGLLHKHSLAGVKQYSQEFIQVCPFATESITRVYAATTAKSKA